MAIGKAKYLPAPSRYISAIPTESLPPRNPPPPCSLEPSAVLAKRKRKAPIRTTALALPGPTAYPIRAPTTVFLMALCSMKTAATQVSSPATLAGDSSSLRLPMCKRSLWLCATAIAWATSKSTPTTARNPLISARTGWGTPKPTLFACIPLPSPPIRKLKSGVSLIRFIPETAI